MANDIVDVLLIGSGASGGPFAWYLSRTRGLKIVCLEQGDWEKAALYTGGGAPTEDAETDEQFQRLLKRPKRAETNYFKNGYPYDHSESYWEPVMGHNVGGATVHYGGSFARMRPSDFVLRTLYGYAEDWPINYADLAPWYDLNDNHVGVAGYPNNPAYPNRKTKFLPVPPYRKGLLEEAADKLGWHHFPGDRAILSVPLNGRDPKDPIQAKNRADVVHWPEAIKNGVELRTRATVREITVNKRGLADGALYYDANGKLHEQKARIVVVACNAIGTPRLLLNSKSSQFPKGLANSSGLVGVGLMGHPMASVVGEFVNDDASRNFGSGTGTVVDEFYDMKWRGGAFGGFRMSIGSLTGPIGLAVGTPSEPLATMIPASLEQGPRRTGRALPWGRLHHAAFQKRFRRTASVGILTSDLAHPENRVELDPTLTDDFGTPAPKIFYTRTENTVKLLAYAMERGKELLLAAGASKIVSAEYERVMGRGAAPGHYMGAARMGSDPERSVVDKWGRAHDVKNLFVIDGSVFTTAGGHVPTSTIQAIALRTADYIKNNFRQLT